MKTNARIYISIITALFFASAAAGYLVAFKNQDGARAIVDQISQVFSFARNWNSFSIFLFIFLNNALKALIILILGILFGLVPLFFVFINGFAIGMIVFVALQKIGAEKVFLGLAPHGILELPAILLAAGYGMWLGSVFYRSLKYGEPFKTAFFWALKKYFKVILPLLFLAAIIEAYLTSYLLHSIK
ncbi:MAG: stage II sporulation protein M [Parcubacteria group bacterium]